MSEPKPDDVRPELIAAVSVGLFVFVVTYISDQLSTAGNAGVSGLTSVMAWAITRILTKRRDRSLPTGVAAVAFVAAIVLGVATHRHADGPPPGVLGFVGGCRRFSVFAENRWLPVGAVVRAAPSRSARQVGFYAPNSLIPIDGWVRTQAALPSNQPPFDSDVWFHQADNQGWVSYAAVRADPTITDPTGFSPDGGRPVPVDPSCSGSVR